MGANLFWRNTFKTLAQNPVTLRAMIAYRILWIFVKLYHYRPAARAVGSLRLGNARFDVSRRLVYAATSLAHHASRQKRRKSLGDHYF